MQLREYKKQLENKLEEIKVKPDDERGMIEAIDVVLTLVMIIVVGAIGIFVADKTITAIGSIGNATLSAMLGNILASGNTGSQFIVILVIAGIGGTAIYYLFGMLRSPGGRGGL